MERVLLEFGAERKLMKIIVFDSFEAKNGKELNDFWYLAAQCVILSVAASYIYIYIYMYILYIFINMYIYIYTFIYFVILVLF